MYASRRAPAIRLDEIRNYKPKHPQHSWDDISDRVCQLHDDDGHAAKVIRALAHGEKVCKEWEEGREEFRIKGSDWRLMGHMAIDSVEEGREPTWVRSAGFEEAWETVPARL